MNISAKTEYACIAVLELAAHYESGRPLRIRTIAERHGIPARFLVQILLQLKGAGMVASTRGAAGGYRLLKDPKEVTLGDVMAVIEGRTDEIKSNTTNPTALSKVLLDAWTNVARAQQQMLSQVTLADLLEQLGVEQDHMYYI